MFNIKNSIALLVINLMIVLSTGYQQHYQQPHSQYGPAPVGSNSYRQTIQSYSHPPAAALPVSANGHPLIQHPPPQYAQYSPVASRSPTYEVVNGHPQPGHQNSPQYSFAASRSQPLVHGQPQYIHVPPTQPGQVTRSHQIVDARTGEVILKKHYGTDGKYVIEETRYHSNPKEQFKPLIDLALRSSPYQHSLPMHHETRETNVFHSTDSLHPMNSHPAGNQYQGRSVVDPKRVFYSRNDYNNEEPSPIVKNLSHQSAGSSNPRYLESIVSYIQSSDFMETIKSMGKSNDFKSTVIRAAPEASIEKDDILISQTSANSGLNFTHGDEDCVPRKTIVKFGDQNKPEKMYNPPSVEILRCPEACFSWQFDCLPVTTSVKKIEVAVYTIANDHQVNRTSEVFNIPIHTKCACKCQTFSSCFGNVSFGFSRFSNQPKNFKSNLS